MHPHTHTHWSTNLYEKNLVISFGHAFNMYLQHWLENAWKVVLIHVLSPVNNKISTFQDFQI